MLTSLTNLSIATGEELIFIQYFLKIKLIQRVLAAIEIKFNGHKSGYFYR